MFNIPKTRIPLEGMPYLTFIIIISTISATMLLPIFPLYLKNLVSKDALVGYIFTYIGIMFLFYSLIIRKLLEKIKKITLLKVGFLGSSATLLVLTAITNIKQFLILEIFRAFFLVSTAIAMGLFIREYATIKSIGKAEGQHFTILNIGFLIGPLLGGLLGSVYSFNTVFVIVAIPQFLIALILSMQPLKESQIKHTQKFNLLDYFKNRQLFLLYIIEFGLLAWFVTLYSFLPLYANENGFSARFIGYILFASVIPLLLLEFPIGKLADLHGFRSFISFGFVIMGLLTVSTYFTQPLTTIIIIIIATVGAAFVEPLIEAYFFKEVRTKYKEENFYPIYKTSNNIAQIVFPLILSTILLFFSFKILFIVIGIFMLMFSLLALKLER